MSVVGNLHTLGHSMDIVQGHAWLKHTQQLTAPPCIPLALLDAILRYSEVDYTVLQPHRWCSHACATFALLDAILRYSEVDYTVLQPHR